MRSPKVIFSYRVLFVCLFVKVVESAVFAAPVPFKFPEDKTPKDFEMMLERESAETAVISGAGVAGLVSAIAIHRTGRYKNIIIVEKRTEFSRDNVISLKPQSIPMMRELGILEIVKGAAILAPHSRAVIDQVSEGAGRQELVAASGAFEAAERSRIDFSQPVSEVFRVREVPSMAIEISALQEVLAQAILSIPGIFLLHGMPNVVGEVGITPSINAGVLEGRDGVCTPPLCPAGAHPSLKEGVSLASMKSVRIDTLDPSFETINVSRPNLIVIAEGSRSATRQNLDIDSVAVKNNESWVTGFISLSKWILKNQVPGNIAFLKIGGDTIFSVFRPLEWGDLFVLATPYPNEHPEECLQRSAFRILNWEANRFGFTQLPKMKEELEVTRFQSVEVSLNKSSRIYDSSNIVLVGDAAGTGSPSVGLGASLVLSVYMEALMSLATSLRSTQFEERKPFLDRYQTRVGEIVDFWHSLD